MKICLFGADFSTGNMGVSALASGCVKSILHSFPDAEIILYNYDKKNDSVTCIVEKNSVVLQTVCLRFSKNILLKNHIIRLMAIAFLYRMLPSRIGRKLVGGNKYLAHLSSADMVASIAGGDSFSDIYGIYRFVFIVLPQILAIVLKKKPILLPQTHGPFKHGYAKAVVRFIYNNSSVIYSRDHTGIGELRDLLAGTPAVEKIRFCYDVAFVLDPIKPETTDIDQFFLVKKNYRNIIGLNISGLLFMGGLNRKNQFGLKTDYTAAMVAIANKILEKQDTCLLIIPHVFVYNPLLEGDPLPCKQVYDLLLPGHAERLFVLQRPYNQHEIKYLIGQCTFFIGARMHACIAAISQGIPAVSIAYSKKFIGVMHSIGCEDLVVDPRKHSEHELVGKVEDIYAQKESYRKIINSKLPEVRNKVLHLFENAAEKNNSFSQVQ